MKHVAFGALALFDLANPAVAFEDLTFGDLKMNLAVGVNGTIVHATAMADSTSGYVDLTLTYTRPIDELTFGAVLFSQVVVDANGDPAVTLYDDPYVDPGLWLEGDRFGYLS